MNKQNHKFKYPKLLLLMLTIILALVFFYESTNYAPFNDFVISLKYLGTFLAGLFYSYGFTSNPATAILLILAQEQNILLATLIASIGTLLSDLLIFIFIKNSFIDEIEKLKKEKTIKYLQKKTKTIFGHYYKYIIPTIAAILIASPLPTEIGITMMTSIKKISIKKFIIIAYILHTLGILTILLIGNHM